MCSAENWLFASGSKGDYFESASGSFILCCIIVDWRGKNPPWPQRNLFIYKKEDGVLHLFFAFGIHELLLSIWFSRAWHREIFSVGLDEQSLKWFHGSRSDRMVKDFRSTSICTGVLQGSNLEPLMFTLHMNSIISASSNCNVYLYADDTILYVVGSSLDFAIANLHKSTKFFDHTLT